MRTRTALIIIFAVVFVTGVPAFVGTLAWIRITDPYKGFRESEQFVDIPQGAGSADIAARLAAAGVVPDALTFRVALWWTGQARALKAGEYRFERPMTPVAVAEKLGRGDVYVQRVTFREGLTIAEMASVYAARGLGESRAFVDAAGDASLVRDLDPAAPDLEGYLFPDTYALPRTASAPTLVGMMVARFKQAYGPDLRARAAAQRLSTRSVVTLASLVEKETASPDERALVAAVYRNRLAIGMAMQADPTVVYALRKRGGYDGNIRREDLAIDSPYNTYRYPGLPPGPIAAPGRAAIEATLAPAAAKAIYFVSRNDGSHAFAETLAEHNANVRRYQVLYFREQRLARAREAQAAARR